MISPTLISLPPRNASRPFSDSKQSSEVSLDHRRIHDRATSPVATIVALYIAAVAAWDLIAIYIAAVAAWDLIAMR